MSTTAATATQMKNELPWWLILIEGISAIILGFFFLRSPAQTTFWVTQFLGIWWFIGGIFDIVGIFMDKSRWGWKLFSGILGIIAGILIIGHPAWSTLIVPATLVIILGIEGIIIGIVYLIRAFQGGGWGAGILGALSIIMGIYLLANPAAATLALPWVAGLLLVVGGIALIVFAFKAK